MAAAWLSPPSPLAFSLSGGVFGAFPHRTILCAWNRVLNPFLSRDGPPELLCLLWPPSIRVRSAGGIALRGLPRALGHQSVGVPPRVRSRLRSPTVLARGPRCLDFPPLRWRNLNRDLPRGRSGIAAGPVVGLPRCRMKLQSGRCASLRRHQWVYTGISLVPAGTAAVPNLLLSLVRWVPGPTSPARIHSREVALPSANRCHPIRSFRPRASIPPRRFALRAGFQAVAPGTGPDFAPFPPRAPADRRWLPSCARCGRRDVFP